MRSTIFVASRIAITALWFGGAAFAQGPPGFEDMRNMKLVAPSAPLPGDAAMSCADIASEMYGIMKKRGVGKNSAEAVKAACDAKNSPPSAAKTAPLVAHAMTTMSAMNDPRLMRLGLLSQERHCADHAPPPQGDDPCDDARAPQNLQSKANASPSVKSEPADANGAVTDPFVKKGTPAAATNAPDRADPFEKR